jgi:hypothetical protein
MIQIHVAVFLEENKVSFKWGIVGRSAAPPLFARGEALSFDSDFFLRCPVVQVFIPSDL